MQVFQTQECVLCASRIRSIRFTAKSWRAWASDTTGTDGACCSESMRTAVCSVPPQWTDVAAPDPEIVLGEGRALCRVADLLELARLVDQIRQHRPPVPPRARVKETVPHM